MLGGSYLANPIKNWPRPTTISSPIRRNGDDNDDDWIGLLWELEEMVKSL